MLSALNIDLFQPPRKVPSFQNDTNFTHGDEHGNVLKVIYEMAIDGLLEIVDQDYLTLARLYQVAQEGIINESHLQQYREILNRIIIHDVEKVFTQGGDLFCDRGGNDLFTLLFLKKVGFCEKLQFISPVGNHDHEFLSMWANNFPIENEANALDRGKPTLSEIAHSPKINADQTRSYVKLHVAMHGCHSQNGAGKLISKEEVDALVEDYFLPTLRLITYSTNENPKSILIYRHAAVDVDPLYTIQALALYYGIEYSNTTRENLTATIDNINHIFLKKILNKTPFGNRSTYGKEEYKKIQTLINDALDEIGERRNQFKKDRPKMCNREGNILKAHEKDLEEFTVPIKAECYEKYPPFSHLFWGKGGENPGVKFTKKLEDNTIIYSAHGHDGADKNRAQKLTENRYNLDSSTGKFYDNDYHEAGYVSILHSTNRPANPIPLAKERLEEARAKEKVIEQEKLCREYNLQIMKPIIDRVLAKFFNPEGLGEEFQKISAALNSFEIQSEILAQLQEDQNVPAEAAQSPDQKTPQTLVELNAMIGTNLVRQLKQEIKVELERKHALEKLQVISTLRGTLLSDKSSIQKWNDFRGTLGSDRNAFAQTLFQHRQKLPPNSVPGVILMIIGILFTGILPGLLALLIVAANAYAKRGFAFYKTEGQGFLEKLEKQTEHLELKI
jgi:hypothetical protein